MALERPLDQPVQLGLLVVVIALPLSDATRSQLLNLVGVVLSAGIALEAARVIPWLRLKV